MKLQLRFKNCDFIPLVQAAVITRKMKSDNGALISFLANHLNWPKIMISKVFGNCIRVLMPDPD